MKRDSRNKRSLVLSFKKEQKPDFFAKRRSPPGNKQKTLSFVIACGFGSGAFPYAPGSAGSLTGLILGLLLLNQSHILLFAGAIIATIGGTYAIRNALSTEEADADPGWIVIDEIAGQMIALLPLHHITWPGAALSFALFRLFDILKPGPVGWADRQGGPWGIMADDVIAGALAALVLLAAQATLSLA